MSAAAAAKASKATSTSSTRRSEHLEAPATTIDSSSNRLERHAVLQFYVYRVYLLKHKARKHEQPPPPCIRRGLAGISGNRDLGRGTAAYQVGATCGFWTKQSRDGQPHVGSGRAYRAAAGQRRKPGLNLVARLAAEGDNVARDAYLDRDRL